MGRYIKSLKIPGTSDSIKFMVPQDNVGRVHLLCGENSVGKTYVLNKLEFLWRRMNTTTGNVYEDNGFVIEIVDNKDSLDGNLSLYYGKIWKQKDRCASFHFSNTKKKEVAPSDGPVSLFSSTLRFIYDCAFDSNL